jgi:phosphatidate cytidylyltransferase
MRTADLRARVVVAIPLAAFAIFIVAAGNPIFAIGAVVLGLLCLHELYALLDGVRPARLAGFLALIGLALAAGFGGRAEVLLVATAALPLVFVLTLAGPSAEGGTFGMAAVLLGVWWIGIAIAHAILLRDLPHGGGIVIDVLIGTFVGDTGAYFGGRWFGRRPLAPRISPKKTVEGLVIGLGTAVLFVWLAGTYQDWLGGWEAVVLGLAVGIAAPIGDLFESFIKRDVGTKDTGRIFGAHGGALDRLDAVLFALVVGYYVWRALM